MAKMQIVLMYGFAAEQTVECTTLFEETLGAGRSKQFKVFKLFACIRKQSRK